MKACIEARQWLYRALRTAVQAAAGVIAANLAAWVSGITDGASVKTVAINAGAVIISAVVAAVMNIENQSDETEFV